MDCVARRVPSIEESAVSDTSGEVVCVARSEESKKAAADVDAV